MAMTGDPKVREMQYDARAGRYHGTVVFAAPAGLTLARVSAAGPPGWGHARAAAALAEAGRQACLPVPAAAPPSARL
jgi:hypothetical protein